MVGEVYGDRLRQFEDIRRVYDFDTFVKGYRPKAADHGITYHYSLEMELRDGDKVFVRSKKAIGAKTPWSDWSQMYPSPLDLSLADHKPHDPDTVPPVMDNNDWDELHTHVAPSLTR